MIQIRVRVAGRSWIEMSARAREVGRIASAHSMDMHAMRARRYALKVINDLHEAAVGDLIFIELDGAGDFLARDLGGCFLNHVLIDGDAAGRCTGCACAAPGTATPLPAASFP